MIALAMHYGMLGRAISAKYHTSTGFSQTSDQRKSRMNLHLDRTLRSSLLNDNTALIHFIESEPAPSVRVGLTKHSAALKALLDSTLTAGQARISSAFCASFSQ